MLTQKTNQVRSKGISMQAHLDWCRNKSHLKNEVREVVVRLSAYGL